MRSVPITDDPEKARLGYFWPLGEGPIDLSAGRRRGQLRVVGQWVEVETLNEDGTRGLFAELPEPPDAMLASVLEDTALLLHVDGLGGTYRMGPSSVSIDRFRAHSLVSSVPVERVRSARLLAAEVHFLGLQGWWPHGAPIEMQATMDDRGRSAGVEFSTRNTSEETCSLGRGRTLTVGTTWEATGGWDSRSLTAPLSFRSSSRTPREAFEHLQPLLLVQALLSFAHRGFVRACGGRANPDTAPRADGRDDPHAQLWVGSLMEPWPAVSEASGRNTPLLTLKTMSGVEGVARWCRLGAQHPRAFSPVIDQYHSGRTSAPVALRDVAAGIEYWVACHRRSAAWAEKKAAAKGEPARSSATNLAEHVGKSFHSWVGDSARWAEAFWKANNGLKHDPAYAVDFDDLSDLAESGRLLLGAAILNRAARTKAPSRRIFGHHTLDGLGGRIRRLTAE